MLGEQFRLCYALFKTFIVNAYSDNEQWFILDIMQVIELLCLDCSIFSVNLLIKISLALNNTFHFCKAVVTEEGQTEFLRI